jgi:hypothetical protein
MKARTSLLIVLSAALMIVAACGKSIIPIKGNGNVETETRILSGFSKIDNEGAYEVYIIQDDQSEVAIEAESNLIPHIRTEISGSTLRIYSKENLKTHYTIKLYIHTPDVNGVTLSGSGLIDLGEVHTDNLEVELSGSGDIKGTVYADQLGIGINGSGTANIGTVTNSLDTYISGSGDMYFGGAANTANFKISGSGSVRAYELEIKTCYTNISGSGDMYLHVIDYLDVKISGSGSIYYGYPQVTTDISGSGQVVSVN